MPNFEFLVTKLVMDEKFAADFHADREKVLRDIGIDPTKDLLAALDNVDYAAISQAASLMPHQSTKPN